MNESTKAFHGFAVDLFEKIADKAGVNYELSLQTEGRYGVMIDGKMSGMIGDVAEKKADFALADITVRGIFVLQSTSGNLEKGSRNTAQRRW